MQTGWLAMTPDMQMKLLARVHAQREHRLALALAECERQCQLAQSQIDEQTRVHAAAREERRGQIAALAKQYGKPQHVWAYIRALDQNDTQSVIESQKQRDRQSDLADLNAQRENARLAQVAAQRRSAKMAELRKYS